MTSAWPEAGPPVADSVVRRLRAAGCVFAEEEAQLLLEAAGTPDELRSLLERRAAGEPLEHVLGWAEFSGLRAAVGRGVFVPRRRSALLVRLALAHLAPHGPGPGRQARQRAVVLDLCCGSAALGAAVAAGLASAGRACELHAADVDPQAAAYARQNVGAWSGHVHVGDLFAALPAGLKGRVDVVVANAPYVPSAEIPFLPSEARDHEPGLALDGGPDGLAVHGRIAAGVGEWLAPGGAVLFEVAERQAADAAGLLAAVGLAPRIERDEDLQAVAVAGIH